MASESEFVWEPLSIERAEDGKQLVLTVRGELDLASAPALKEELAFANSNGFKDLVIDLSGLDFMDSAGVSLLVGAWRAGQEHGYRLRLRRPSEQVHRLLELTGLVERVSVED